jgi:CHAT domain-containing protein
MGSAIELARDALRTANADPRQAVLLADRAAKQALADGDGVAGAIAARARGLAAFHLEDSDTAVMYLREAIALGRTAGSETVVGEARMTLAFVMNWRGQPRVAMREINTAIAALRGVERARARAQRGAILHQLGRVEEALADYRAALPALRQAEDELWIQRVLSNRGIVHTERHEFAAAEADLSEASRICHRLNLSLLVGIADQNLGTVKALQGDIPAALELYGRSEDCYRENGAQLGPLLSDKCELLLSARLVTEARITAKEAVKAYSNEKRRLFLPDARLLLARIAQLDGDLESARAQALAAQREFRSADRREWAALSYLFVIILDVSRGVNRRLPQSALERAILASRDLRPDIVVEARLAAAQLAAARGQSEIAARELRTASQYRRRGAATLRARAWYAEALLRRAAGDRRGAQRAAGVGLRILDEFAAALGATDVRAHVASHRIDLAELGVRIAIDAHSGPQSFTWAERGRASHLSSVSVRPPDDPRLADALAELRLITHDIDEARSAGRAVGSLEHRQAALERRIRDDLRRRRASSPATIITPDMAQLVTALGSAAVLEYVAIDGVLYAISLASGRFHLRRLGALDEIHRLADRLPFALHRMARRNASKESREAALSLLRSTVERLDKLMIQPMTDVDDRRLVIVPTGSLQWLPWSVLPSCHGRPLTVSPSASLWYAAMARRRSSGHALVVAGPGLPGARREAEAVARAYKVTPLVGPAATVSAVSEMMTAAALAHLAAHGRVRSDNPQFGSLRLHDGPLMIYDLERLDRAPHTVVVAACDAGRPVVPVGDELLGLTASLLSHGSAQLIASVLPVLDTETAPLMMSFHAGLNAGMDAAAALAQAQQSLAAEGFEGIATAAGFLCFGAGFTRPNVARGTR